MIIRGEYECNYTVIHNDLANDERLHWEDRGLLVYLLSKPENWRVSPSAIMKVGNAGRDKVYAMLGRLEDAGYARRVRRRSSNGQMAEVDWYVYGTPQLSTEGQPFPENQDMDSDPQKSLLNQCPPPRPDLPDTAEPYTANPTLQSNDLTKEREGGRVGMPGDSIREVPWGWEPELKQLQELRLAMCPVPNQQSINEFIAHARTQGIRLEKAGSAFVSYMVKRKRFMEERKNGAHRKSGKSAVERNLDATRALAAENGW